MSTHSPSVPDEPVTVYTSAAGQPVRLVWRTRRFRVTDTPTTLVGTSDWWNPLAEHSYGVGHPPLSIAGWRFQATADDGETHVFDVTNDGGHHWQLVRIFD